MLNTSELPFVIFMCSLCLMGTCLNGSILIVYRRKYKHSASLYYLTWLALVNFLISCLVIPFTLITDMNSTASFYSKTARMCGLSYFMRHFFSWVSQFLLVLIAYERYTVIAAKTVKGLRLVERNLVMQSRKATLLIILISFCISVVCFMLLEEKTNDLVVEIFKTSKNKCNAIVIEFNLRVYHLVTVAIGLSMYVFMVVLYSRAYYIVYKSSKRVIVMVNAKQPVSSKRNQSPSIPLMRHSSTSTSSGEEKVADKKLFVRNLLLTYMEWESG